MVSLSRWREENDLNFPIDAPRQISPERLVSRRSRRGRKLFRVEAAAPFVERVHWPAEGERAAGDRIAGGQIARRGAGPCAALRTSGLGKTTLASIIANELDVGFQQTSGPALQIQGDLTAILTNLRERQVLFLDEIHRLQPVLEEKLYTALEDYKLDIIIGQGPAARTHVMDIKPFTFVAATTRPGLLSSPLRSRFGILLRLEFYKRRRPSLHRRTLGRSDERSHRSRRSGGDSHAFAGHPKNREPLAAAGPRLRTGARHGQH